jgi:hypothetical protein
MHSLHGLRCENLGKSYSLGIVLNIWMKLTQLGEQPVTFILHISSVYIDIYKECYKVLSVSFAKTSRENQWKRPFSACQWP